METKMGVRTPVRWACVTRIEAETAAKVEAGGTTMVAVMSTLAEAMVMVTYDGSTPAADAMLDARAVVSL